MSSISCAGAPRLARAIRAAGRDLEHMAAANRAWAQSVLQAANPPRRSGALAGSLRVEASETEGAVVSDLVYAPVIEHGWPGHGIEARHFLQTAADRQAERLDPYMDTIDDALAGVEGTY